jgi:nucleotide-binding universal stress UspA family protein
LVPVDLTGRHERALALAAELTARPNGRVTLLHVIEVPHGLTTADDPNFYRDLEQKSREHLKHMVERLRKSDLDAHAVVSFGERGPEILRYALRENVDLIVVSSHPIDPTSPGASWLSLSYFIGIGAHCPVLLVK